MDIVNRISAFQNCQFFSDIIAERLKPAGEKRAIIKRANKAQWWCFGYGVIMILTNEENSEFIKSSATFTPLNSFRVRTVTRKSKIVNGSLKCHCTDWKFNLPIWQKILLGFFIIQGTEWLETKCMYAWTLATIPVPNVVLLEIFPQKAGDIWHAINEASSSKSWLLPPIFRSPKSLSMEQVPFQYLESQSIIVVQ